jgi:hypothetical protein
MKKVIIALQVAVMAYKNPNVLTEVNFKMLCSLLKLILEVSESRNHRLSHLCYLHPEEGQKEIVSIWAGAGVGAEPIKRIEELISENQQLKNQLSKLIDSTSPHQVKNNRSNK